MAATLALAHPEVPWISVGKSRMALAALTLDNSYPSGGYPLAPGQLNLTQLFNIDVACRATGTAATQGYVPQYDYVNKTVRIFQQTAATGPLVEVTAATNLTGVVIDVTMIGA